MFEGLSVAMVTPFKNGAIDYTATANLVEFMIEGGVQGLVVSGSTGEAATTSFDEKRELWKFVKAQAKGRVWIVAGTGTNDTAVSIAITKMAEEVGVDGAMVVTPFYNKPSAKGQVAHFDAVAKSTKLPVILYNVPGRTGTNTLPDTLAQVTAPNVKAVKEASGSLDQMAQVKQKTRFTLLSGDDSLTLPAISVGGEGIISVVGQVVPREMRALTDAARAGRLDEARALNDKLAPIFKAAFIESNPSPTKFLLSRMGICANELRLPLVPVEPASETAILAAAEKVGVKLASAVYA
ncbi:MAG: 4-hydroxy-tetrahydrodipicolinate synthase [Candidatus Eisenbacteria bacterium]|uniref:4-hydroxy-tetrahydrodipicolinate synthase n=1 Tax=Eiseniibacteriota bacterium TaxID=2212470 RepID=A0A933SD71_UNCEI|nr:4-hydroxy-tetrahydrodipicolinate synthase [Candidatus Eisenbacteria bacterium]